MSHEIHKTDLMFALKYAKSPIVGVTPCPVDEKTGKINPHSTRFHLANGKYLSVFASRPEYYETPEGYWRPMYEVGKPGNRFIRIDKWWRVSSRYLHFLKGRCELLGGKLELPSYSHTGLKLRDTILHKAGSISLEVNPDADPESTTVDGLTRFEGDCSPWSTCTSSTAANVASDAGAALTAYCGGKNC